MRPVATFREFRIPVWVFGSLLAVVSFLLLAWGALGPGKIWAFDRLAHAGSGMVLKAGEERLFGKISEYSGVLAILWGILVFLAFLIQWIRTRRFPRTPGIAVFVLGGTNLCTQIIKSALPHVLGVLGFPISLAVGFPSGHTTMAVSFALTLLILAPSRWRPWSTPVVGLGGALVSCSLLFRGYHPPSDILGAVLLTFLLAILAMKHLPGADSRATSGGFERASALLVCGLGLVGLISGALVFISLDSTLPGPAGALAAYGAGWRMVAGSTLVAIGIGALRLAPPPLRLGFGRSFLAVAVIFCCSVSDFVFQSVQRHSWECRPRAALEDELLHLVWLSSAEEKITSTGDGMRWAIGGDIPKWEFLAGLEYRIRSVDRALVDFGRKPMEDAEREAFARLIENWPAYREALKADAALLREGQGLWDRRKAVENLQYLQAKTEASLSSLLERGRRTAWRDWAAQGEKTRPSVLGLPI